MEMGVLKIGGFRPIVRLTSKNIGLWARQYDIDVGLTWRYCLRNYCIQRDAAEAWIKDERYGHRMRSMDGATFSDHEWPVTEILRSRHH